MSEHSALLEKESPGAAPRIGERRATRRLKLAQPVRIRPADPRYPEEVLATVNFSRRNLYFRTRAQHYYLGMHVEIVFPYRAGDPFVTTIFGEVARLERLQGTTWGVAIKFLKC
jgi:hypothetical protein